MATDSDQIRATVDRYIMFMNAGDFDSIAELYAEHATVEDPVGNPPSEGREAIRKFYAGAVGNVALERTGPVRVAAGEAAFPMQARIGGDHQLDIIDLMVFNDDGQIESMRAFWNLEDAPAGSVPS